MLPPGITTLIPAGTDVVVVVVVVSLFIFVLVFLLLIVVLFLEEYEYILVSRSQSLVLNCRIGAFISATFSTVAKIYFLIVKTNNNA